jgi:hypothetical protein
MSIPAWQVITWTPVETTVGEFSRLLGRFQHLGTSVHTDEPARGLKYGQVLWALEHGSSRIGLAWDWAEVREHVIAMADPMKVLSNVALRRDDGAALPEAERLLHLNGAIHGWRWQAQVLAPQPQRWRGRLAA